MKDSISSFIRRNAAAVSAIVTYSICLLTVIFLGECSSPLTAVMACLGIAGIILWLGIHLVTWFKITKVSSRRLCLSGIEKTLRVKGMNPERAGEKQVLFRHFFNEVQWTVQYEEETGRLVIGLVFPLDNSNDTEIVKSAASEVMSRHRMVRLYLKSQGDRKFFFLAIESFLSSQMDFDRFLDRYLELVVAAMQDHDSLCHEAVEARRPKERPKIGFVSPMREKIVEFDKENPEATETERRNYIESLRK